MIFEEKLKFWAEKKFQKLKFFAEAMEIQPSTLTRYLKGEQKPGFEFLYKMHKLGCDLNWLLSDSEENYHNYLIRESNFEYQAKNLEQQNEELKSELKEMKQIINNGIELLNNVNKTKQMGKAE